MFLRPTVMIGRLLPSTDILTKHNLGALDMAITYACSAGGIKNPWHPGPLGTCPAIAERGIAAPNYYPVRDNERCSGSHISHPRGTVWPRNSGYMNRK